MTVRVGKIVETAPSAQRILTVLRAAQVLRSMVLIVGEPGTGKTAALRHYAATAGKAASGAATVRTITAEPATGELRGFLIELSVALGDRSEYAFRRQAYLATKRAAERIDRFMEDANPEPCLLIVDDAQHLCAAALEQLRSFHDRTGLAVALVGNSTAAGKLAPLAALTSRIGMKLVLTAPAPDDIDAIAERHGVADKAARRHLRQSGGQPGGLHNVMNAIAFAGPLAGPGVPLELRHFELAATLTGTGR